MVLIRARSIGEGRVGPAARTPGGHDLRVMPVGFHPDLDVIGSAAGVAHLDAQGLLVAEKLGVGDWVLRIGALLLPGACHQTGPVEGAAAVEIVVQRVQAQDLPGVQQTGGVGQLHRDAVGLSGPGDGAVQRGAAVLVERGLLQSLLTKPGGLRQLLHRPVISVGPDADGVAQVLHRPGLVLLRPEGVIVAFKLHIPEPEHLTQIAVSAVGGQPTEHRAGAPAVCRPPTILLPALQNGGQVLLGGTDGPAQQFVVDPVVKPVVLPLAVGVQGSGHGCGPVLGGQGQGLGHQLRCYFDLL